MSTLRISYGVMGVTLTYVFSADGESWLDTHCVQVVQDAGLQCVPLEKSVTVNVIPEKLHANTKKLV